MTQKIILGDWGTTSCRLYLFDMDKGESLEATSLPGMKFVNLAQDAFLNATASWTKHHGPIKAILCGMVGSNIGWVNTGYAQCPANFSDFQKLLTSIETPDRDIWVIPGVQTLSNQIGLPDVMRGEETQIIGWAKSTDSAGLACLPGTHTKWATVTSDSIVNFTTSITGELFDIIRKNSVLTGGHDSKPEIGEAFLKGLDVAASTSAPAAQTLMSVRSQQIIGAHNSKNSQSYLLGLLIGSDVAASLPYAQGELITVIGGDAPAQFYAHAIHHLGGKAVIFDGQVASLAGLKHFASHQFA